MCHYLESRPVRFHYTSPIPLCPEIKQHASKPSFAGWRASEHTNTFNKFKGANVYLRCYARIDPEYLTKAEADLRVFFKSEECLFTDNKSYEELVVLNKRYVKSTVFDKFTSIGAIYEGRFSNMKVLEMKIQHLNKELTSYEKIIAEKERLINVLTY